MNANNKKHVSPSSENHEENTNLGHSPKAGSVVKMTALLTLLTLAATNTDAQVKKSKLPATKREATKRAVPQKDSVAVKTKPTTTVQFADTINNPLAHYGYPFTLKIFDANDLTFTEEKLDELKNFIETDLKDKSKRRQIAVNFLRGDRESRKELFLKKIENIF